MANIHQDNDNVYIDLWDKTLTFNSIEYALYQLNSAFELRISKDIDAILNYRINGVPYKVSTVNGRQTNDICPYSWESLEYVRQTINETRLCVNDVFTSYGISLTPNWREINKKWLAEVDRLEKIFGEVLGNSAQAALNNQAQKYQQAYSEELSKDFGLSFGILSSSWTAHLLYAAQSAAKERKDHARAERVAADAMKNSHVDITAQIFATVYPIYVDSLEPAMQKLLSEYYAYVIAIFSKELHCSYDNVAATFDFKRSNGFILGVSADAKANILQALQAFPNNGNVIGYAIKNGVLDDELCKYGKNAPKNFGIILKKWAISVLSEIYTAGKLFNKPLVTDENRVIVEGLIKYYDYTEEDALGADDWQEILSVVYGDELTDVGDLFEIFDDLKESNANITKYAQANKKLAVSDEMIKKFITACEMKDGSCSWYAINMDIDTDQPISVEQVRECIKATNDRIKVERVRLDEQRRIDEERKAEEKRIADEQARIEQQQKDEQLRIKRDQFAKKVKKIAFITTPILVALIAFIVTLNTKIIPSNNYEKGVELFNKGEYFEASCYLFKAKGYSDAEDYLIKLHRTTIVAGGTHTVGLKKDGTVVAVGDNEKGQCNVSKWSNIVSIAAGYDHTVGLRADGTVVAVGDNSDGQCNVSAWKDVVMITTGDDNTIALTSKGKILVAGDSSCYGDDYTKWTNIVDVAASDYHMVGLKSDGTVVACGWSDVYYRESDVSKWSNVVSVDADSRRSIGIKADGTLVSTKKNSDGENNISNWNNVVQVYVTYWDTIALKADGSIMVTGEYSTDDDYSNWKNIVAISISSFCRVGLKSDGTVISVGSDWHGRDNVGTWKDIDTDIIYIRGK